MSQISEMDMTYSMDCYFRQSWVDERLAFSDLEEAFTLSVSVLDKLWKPDTFIYNGMRSYVHLITTPNKFIRLYQNGRILYSSRLTINANCPMNLHDFPMDTQRCPLRLGSFAYTTSDVIYRWNRARQVVIAPDLMLSQFDLIATPSGFENTTRTAGEFSTLLASFHLQRHMGNFMITVYGPCVLLVVLSWVSFWLNREATSDRISLGITTVLTMTFLGLEARTDLPKVPYSTALDLFVWLSYGFIFATIIEFAFVHVFTKVGSGEVYLSQASSEADSSDDDLYQDDDDGLEDEQAEPVAVCLSVTEREVGACPGTGPNGVGTSSRPKTPPFRDARFSFFSRLAGLCGREKARTHSTTIETIDQLKEVRRAVQRHQRKAQAEADDAEARRWTQDSRSGKRTNPSNKLLQMNSVSNIDEISRILFPLSFLCINFLYWYTFLSHNPWPPDYL
ncbi:gamma-aminobutyric acid receptor alpha-like [Procambarus clarkii]|uniref:gamma-aminobutyric acid receptor alpha-like n=1 Tax=Procambarus clarkii TaxID=6728 RepID=UPI0037443DCB